MSRPRSLAAWAFVVLAIQMIVGGCASSPASPAPIRVDASDYPRAFQAAKDLLRDEGYTLDRVDARRGVITTLPRAGAGIATPWISNDRTLGASVDDLVHNQARAVAVEFGVAGASGAEDDTGADDLRRTNAPVEVRVVAEVVRAERWGRRVDSTMPRRSTFTIDPVAARAGESAASIRVIRRDSDLEAWLAERLSDRLRDAR